MAMKRTKTGKIGGHGKDRGKGWKRNNWSLLINKERKKDKQEKEKDSKSMMRKNKNWNEQEMLETKRI